MTPLARPDCYIIRTLYYILNFCIIREMLYAVQCRSRMSNAINGKLENNYTDDVIIYFLSTRSAALYNNNGNNTNTICMYH